MRRRSDAWMTKKCCYTNFVIRSLQQFFRRCSLRRLSVLLTSGWFLATLPASGQSAYQIVIDTSNVAGQPGKLSFDLTSNRLRTNRADIVNFSTDGTLSLSETQGGLVSGDLIAGKMPAQFTRIGGNEFFNELLLNFDRFGQRITFSINVSESRSGDSVPDQFAMYLLDSEGRSLTRARHGAGRGNPNFTVTITGERGGDLAIYDRTIDKGRRGKIHADDPERQAIADFTITPIWISVEEENKLPVTEIEGELEEFCTRRCNAAVQRLAPILLVLPEACQCEHWQWARRLEGVKTSVHGTIL